MSASVIIAGLGLVLLLEVLRSHRQLRLALDEKPLPDRLGGYPSVSVIRPIKGLDAGAEDNLRAALDHGYPGEVETIFVFDDETEPVVPLAHEAIREHEAAGRPGSARILFSGSPEPGFTGKMNAMIAGLAEASGELVAFADSDIRPDRDGLRVLVESLLGNPVSGAAFAPVIVTEPARTVGDAGYALLLNGLYGASAAETANKHDGKLPFIMGQFMVFRREALTAIGGLESSRGQLVDDMYIGARLHAAGYENVVSPRSVPIIQFDLGLKSFWSIYMRWIAFSRSGLPGKEFKLSSWIRGTVYWLGLIAAALALTQGWYLAALSAGLVPLLTSASINTLHRQLGAAPLASRHLWVSFFLLLVAPVIYFKVLGRREVNWRGRTYQLGDNSRLAEGEALPADRGLVTELKPRAADREANQAA